MREINDRYRICDSWGDFLDFVARMPPIIDGMRTRIRNDFHGTGRGDDAPLNSWDGLLAIAHDGWPSGLRDVAKLSTPLVNVIGERIVRLDWYHETEASGCLDMGRYMDNEPECWLHPEETLVDAPAPRLIRVVVNGFYSAGTTEQNIIRRGATTVALIQLLELGGMRVRVEWAGVAKGRQDYNKAEVRVILKDYQDDLDLGRLAFALAHPAAVRGLMFSAWEHFSKEVRDGVGASGDRGYYSSGVNNETEDQGDIYIPSGSLENIGRLDDAGTQAWLLKQLTAQGVTLREEEK